MRAIRPEVEQQSERQVQQSQVRERLFHVNRGDGVNGFHLEQQRAVHDEIWPECVREHEFIVREMHRLLSPHGQANAREFCREQAFVYGLHDAGAKVAVQQEGSVYCCCG